MSAVANRDRVREHVLGLAESDPSVVAAAVIGSLAHGNGDRWSDLDLTFGVAAESSVADVLDDWTRELADVFDAVPLLDLSRGDLVYRVFLFPDWLQVDLSFAPESVRQTGPAFNVLFGPHSVEIAPRTVGRGAARMGRSVRAPRDGRRRPWPMVARGVLHQLRSRPRAHARVPAAGSPDGLREGIRPAASGCAPRLRSRSRPLAGTRGAPSSIGRCGDRAPTGSVEPRGRRQARAPATWIDDPSDLGATGRLVPKRKRWRRHPGSVVDWRDSCSSPTRPASLRARPVRRPASSAPTRSRS